MRCDICANLDTCETAREIRHTIDRMIMRHEVTNTTKSLIEEIYILVAQYCATYIEEL